jgi:hypothetical protein
MTLDKAAAAKVRLIVWCRDCGRQVERDPAEMAERYGAEMSVPAGTRGLSAQDNPGCRWARTMPLRAWNYGG